MTARLIPHTSGPALLARYGSHAAGRAKAREHIEREIRDGARQLLADSLHAAGRSWRCRSDDHSCANDGSGCLCACHDGSETPAVDRWPDTDLGGVARVVGWRLPDRDDDQSAWADHLGWQATCQAAAIDDYLAETRAAAARVAALARGGATR